MGLAGQTGLGLIQPLGCAGARQTGNVQKKPRAAAQTVIGPKAKLPMYARGSIAMRTAEAIMSNLPGIAIWYIYKTFKPCGFPLVEGVHQIAAKDY